MGPNHHESGRLSTLGSSQQPLVVCLRTLASCCEFCPGLWCAAPRRVEPALAPCFDRRGMREPGKGEALAERFRAFDFAGSGGVTRTAGAAGEPANATAIRQGHPPLCTALSLKRMHQQLQILRFLAR